MLHAILIRISTLVMVNEPLLTLQIISFERALRKSYRFLRVCFARSSLDLTSSNMGSEPDTQTIRLNNRSSYRLSDLLTGCHLQTFQFAIRKKKPVSVIVHLLFFCIEWVPLAIFCSCLSSELLRSLSLFLSIVH